MIRVAVDAMGGDHAPAAVVEGAVEAIHNFDLAICLVGQTSRIKAEIVKYKVDPSRIEIVHAQEIVEMHEPPAVAIRKKKDSSIAIGTNLLKEGRAQAFFSAGNTGGVVCASTLKLGLLESIERPGIAIVLPNIKDNSLIIDAGANIDPKPVHLLQYGIMGSSYCHDILGKNDPRVGLLNIGEEASKGTGFMKETYQLLERSSINFIGNIEGKDIFSGNCDVIVCDGFVGNVTLKVSESMAETLATFLKQELVSNILGKIGFSLARKSFRNFKKRIDYSEYGGAPLLGVNGIVIVGHGRSSAKAVMNAIGFAKREVERNINQNIMDQTKKIFLKV